MKIIGKTSCGYIADIGREELANLLGYYSYLENEYKEPYEGMEVNISGMYKQLRKLATMKEWITVTQRNFREYANDLEPVKPILDEITKE